MKKILTFSLLLALCVSFSLVFQGESSRVIYDGSSRNFIFDVDGTASPTDLFANFKSVMPGDVKTQKITVKNDASNKIKVRLYLRSLGAVEGSEEFLSQLTLQVKQSEDNTMAYMFDAAADRPAQLSDWVCLGTLYSGGEVNLDVTLLVPTELDNRYSSQTGLLTWEFRAEELPLEPGDPQPPPTSDMPLSWGWIVAIGLCAVGVVLLLIWRRRARDDEDEE